MHVYTHVYVHKHMCVCVYLCVYLCVCVHGGRGSCVRVCDFFMKKLEMHTGEKTAFSTMLLAKLNVCV